MSRWIIVSNRLPFSYDQEKNQLKESSGGLVTAIRGIQTDENVVWIGSVPDNVPRKLVDQANKGGQFQYSTLEIDPALYSSYYNDFCNDVLWPILHYENELVKFTEEAWEDYKEVNWRFANHIAEVAKEDDLVWLHDFHLFLVPEYLKKLRPDLKIGFFLHVPFPSSEIYRQLPCREEILRSLIHCDLIGFHDYSYLRHFVSSIYNLLGIHSSLLEINSPYNQTKLGVFPVSIDTKSFISRANSKKTSECIKSYGLNKSKLQYILGVDRLDYTKGLILKLKAFKQFLECNPEYVGKVQLIQIAVPSRTNVEEYINLRREVEQLVSEINGRFSSIDYIPVKYIFNSVTTHELMALYRSSEVLFVTSKRDGMNLVCLEYIAAQKANDPGVVLLSEFAGAASTLSHAILINPMDVFDTSNKLKESLEMDKKQRLKRHKVMFEYLKGYTATAWADSFLNGLVRKSTKGDEHTLNLGEQVQVKYLKKRFSKKKHILMVDYDGTLSPIVNNPEEAHIPKSTKSLLKRLQKLEDMEIVVVSGRSEDFLMKQLEGVDCYLACEHGAKFYDYKKHKWRNLVGSKKSTWYKQAHEIIKEYCRRTPSSFFEKKNYAIAWHYRTSPTDFAEFQARKLVMDLEAALVHLPVSVILGKKVVEVKSLEANKGYFAEWFLSRYSDEDEDVVFAIGDDRTDEDLFEAVNSVGISVKVGNGNVTKAQYYIDSQEKVEGLLENLFCQNT